MAFSNQDIDLTRYQCAQCARTPERAQELFQGCICGHRLFRIIHKNNSSHLKLNKQERNTSYENSKDLDFLTVHEHEIGVYEINVDKLLSNKPNKRQSSPVVVGNEGIFSIHIQQHKKRR
ncbi:MAG: hypothetical protein JSV04_14300 [Candidatus Heimdallarchaeota archaeon]|nr:MAG: hypothetical protein JSV04_14300 [Candidatus Heimdallarchaeota archaeon]